MDLPKWDACLAEPNWLLRWMECHPASTGAAATMLAMISAAAIPIYTWLTDRRTKKLEREAASATFVGTLIAPLAALKDEIVRARTALDDWKNYTSDGFGSDQRAKLAKTALTIPLPLTQALAQMPNFEAAFVSPVRAAMDAAAHYNAIATAFAPNQGDPGFDAARSRFAGAAKDRLDAVERSVDQAIRDCQSRQRAGLIAPVWLKLTPRAAPSPCAHRPCAPHARHHRPPAS